MAICPMMSRPVRFQHDDGSSDVTMEWVDCQREKCRFWQSVYSTEGLRQPPECAIVLVSLTNADGLLVV